MNPQPPRTWKFIGIHWNADKTVGTPIFDGPPVTDEHKFDVIELSAYQSLQHELDEAKALLKAHSLNEREVMSRGLHESRMAELQRKLDQAEAELAMLKIAQEFEAISNTKTVFNGAGLVEQYKKLEKQLAMAVEALRFVAGKKILPDFEVETLKSAIDIDTKAARTALQAIESEGKL